MFACNVLDVYAADEKGVSYKGAVAAPGQGFCAHYGYCLLLSDLDQFLKINPEFLSLHVVRKAPK